MKVIIHQRLMVYSHHEAHVVYETAFCRRNGAASQQNAPSLAPSQFPLIPLLRIRNVSVSYTAIRVASGRDGVNSPSRTDRTTYRNSQAELAFYLIELTIPLCRFDIAICM
jgi:hypothetical protein